MRNNDDIYNRIAGLEYAVKLLCKIALQPEGLTVEQKVELTKLNLQDFTVTGRKITSVPWTSQRGTGGQKEE